jgi:hypothetical protein
MNKPSPSTEFRAHMQGAMRAQPWRVAIILFFGLYGVFALLEQALRPTFADHERIFEFPFFVVLAALLAVGVCWRENRKLRTDTSAPAV